MKKWKLKVNKLENKACTVFPLQRSCFLLGPATCRVSLQLNGKYLNMQVLSLNLNAIPELSHLPQWSCAVAHAAPIPGKTSLTLAPFTWLLPTFILRSVRKILREGTGSAHVFLMLCSSTDHRVIITCCLNRLLYIVSIQFVVYFEKIKERTLRESRHSKSIRYQTLILDKISFQRKAMNPIEYFWNPC